ncbi:hypothetical protein ASE12_18285 [Aeromicrobium sp. Root236]|uniref:hypothetical protein n=1 Tax=Aeromicrobium sp. Root236 TaxID=1736498 RepID=UPI0006FA4E0F|nr:hypothetical protein [Aeromicrobium sp. Root236]KRC66547.1 hypothetical protein ASE12_18285 [Aeromicrobium sp. Root236]
MTRFDVTPEQAAQGRIVEDRDLPMLAAQWLTEGWDSPAVRELAGLTRHQVNDAVGLLQRAVNELGFAQPASHFPWDDAPWHGHWQGIWWAVDQMDKKLSPYAAAQEVLETVGDVPDLWKPGHGDELMQLLERWREHPEDREDVAERLRSLLRSLTEDDVPPAV